MIKSLNDAKIVIKPWGKEIWMELNNKYCYKRLYINAGEKISLQYHNQKHETSYVISGTGILVLDKNQYNIAPDNYFTVQPGQIHRVIATTDLIIQEVSTPEVDDVVRIEDDTNRPSGKIETEHQ